MSKRRALIAGNWKLHGSKQSVVELAGAIAEGMGSASADVVVCPTAVHLSDVAAVVHDTPVLLGAQNCASSASGAFTGEVSPQMLAEYGCSYVIVGHSERRALFGETSEQVAEKCINVRDAGLSAILCVGETLEQREADLVNKVIGEQLNAVLDAGGIELFAELVVAYEPVWAIGTGKTASPEQAQEVHALIRGTIAAKDNAVAEGLRVLYGGSVKPDNAASLFAQQDIDGGLIGGAALQPESFLAICEAAA